MCVFFQGKQDNIFVSVPKVDQGIMYEYHAPSYECNGPPAPATPALSQNK